MHDGNTCLPALCAGEAPDEKLKINKLGPKIEPGGPGLPSGILMISLSPSLH